MFTVSQVRVPAVLIGCFGILSLFVVARFQPLIALDNRIHEHIVSLRNPKLDEFFEWFTRIAGFEGAVLFLLLVTGFLMHKRAFHWAILLWVVATLNLLLVDILKILFNRQRPDAALQLATEASLSYPSGHTMSAVIIFGYGAYLLHLYVAQSRAQVAIMLAWLSFVLLTAFSRMYLGVHFFTDIVAGLLLGGAILYLLSHPPHTKKPYLF